MLMKCIRPAHGGKAPNEVSEAAGRGPAEGRQRTSTRPSAPAAAQSGHPPGGGSPLALEGTANSSGGHHKATCTHREDCERSVERAAGWHTGSSGVHTRGKAGEASARAYGTWVVARDTGSSRCVRAPSCSRRWCRGKLRAGRRHLCQPSV